MPGLNHEDRKFSMKNTGRMMTNDGKPSPRTASSMRALLSKWGMPVSRFAEPTDVYTKCCTPPRLAISAMRFPWASSAYTCLPGVLDREHPPDSLDRALQGVRVVEIALHDLGAELGEGVRRLALRLAGHRAHLATLREQLAGHGAALLAGRAGHQNHVLPHWHRSRSSTPVSGEP